MTTWNGVCDCKVRATTDGIGSLGQPFVVALSVVKACPMHKDDEVKPTSGFECSGRAYFCPKHGYRQKVRSIPSGRDVFGFHKNFTEVCMDCGSVCEYEIVRSEA